MPLRIAYQPLMVVLKSQGISCRRTIGKPENPAQKKIKKINRVKIVSFCKAFGTNLE